MKNNTKEINDKTTKSRTNDMKLNNEFRWMETTYLMRKHKEKVHTKHALIQHADKLGYEQSIGKSNYFHSFMAEVLNLMLKYYHLNK